MFAISKAKSSVMLPFSYDFIRCSDSFSVEYNLLSSLLKPLNIPRSHRISNSKIGNMLEVELSHMERAPSAALTKIEDIYFRMTQTEPLHISKLLSLVFFKPLSLSPSQSLGLTGNFEPLIIAYSKTKSLNVSTSNLFFLNFGKLSPSLSEKVLMKNTTKT
jgi:hypothetical protein